MNPIFPWLGIAVLILCGWAIIKKYQVNMVLLLGGLLLNALAIWGGAQVFPAKFNATGIMGFDLVEFLRTISVSQVSGVGCSPLAAAAVVASVLAIGYAPASGTANLASQIIHLDPIEYLVRYQLPMAVPVVIAMAVAHVFTQYWFDRREGKGEVADLAELESKRQNLEKTPAFYALMPLFPIALLLVFNKFVWGTGMNVATAMFIAWIIAFVIDLIVRRKVKESFDLSFAMFKGMGSILTSTVGLIFVAAFFAKGLQNIGIVDLLMSGAQSIGLGYTGTSVVLSAIIGVVTVLTGSGVAAFTSLGHLVPDAAQAFGENGISMMLMMHTASEMLRAMSPVAGVIIIVAGFAKVNPLTMVKRTIIPCLTGYVVMLVTVNLIV